MFRLIKNIIKGRRKNVRRKGVSDFVRGEMNELLRRSSDVVIENDMGRITMNGSWTEGNTRYRQLIEVDQYSELISTSNQELGKK